MRSIFAIAVLVALLTPVAAGAQARFDLGITGSAPTDAAPAPQSPKFAMPVVNHVGPDGSIATRRGVIAGVEVGPKAMLGLGIFEGAPKRRMGASDPAAPERRAKRVAVGFSLKF